MIRHLCCSVFVGLFVFSTYLSLAAADNAVTSEELSEGWILLFDGETLYGWEAASDANWSVSEGVISASEGEQGLLHTTSEFADYQLKLEFRSPPNTNSGIFLRTPANPADPASDCYELNIAGDGVSPFATGSFVNREKASAGLHTGEWQSYEITARGGKFVVELDGKVVLEYDDPNPVRRGYIGLQKNSGLVEFRNIKLKPLGLEPLFNGDDLSGWEVYPDEKSVFSVTEQGNLKIENGRGQLESKDQFQDFVFQAEIFVNGENLNSGIFFRSIPGEFWNGYESQIHNGYRNDDRSMPVDYGTGGFYRRQMARRVVADDFVWFHKTLVVHGPHMAAWINGYQVSDWTDNRPVHNNPRQGLRLEAGTLIIQGHDPSTDLSFRNLRAGEMPR